MIAHIDQLPDYQSSIHGSSQNGFSTQKYSLADAKGRERVGLAIKSRGKAKDNASARIPLIFQGDRIEGELNLDFANTSAVKRLGVTVTGSVTETGQEELRFLELKPELWNSKMRVAHTGGSQIFPFSIELPSEVVVKNGPKEPFSLPPSFSESGGSIYIDYKVTATIYRGGFRANPTLSTNFIYLPTSPALPPSVLRGLAYREGTPIVGPEGDPEGWETLGPIQIHGTLFHTKPVVVHCNFSVASPLSYAAGSPIPLFIALTSTDEQALDVLSNPSGVRVGLIRERSIGSLATSYGGRVKRTSQNVLSETVSSAIFWSCGEHAKQAGKRMLQGELEVKKGATPSFVFPRFSLRYSICLYGFEAPGFKANLFNALVTRVVTIHSANSRGVLPRPFAPPGYERPKNADYNNAVGYLENGNQRFYHHHGH